MSIISDGYSTYLVLGISPVSAANYVSYANKLSSFILGVWGSGGGGGEASWADEMMMGGQQRGKEESSLSIISSL